MIRLALATDEYYVIGSTTAEGHAARLAALPAALDTVMSELYRADAVVVGARSLGRWGAFQPGVPVFVMSRQERSLSLPHLERAPGFDELVDRYASSDDELLVAGGATIFGMFLPYAAQIDVVIFDEPVPGDVVFHEWETEDLALISERGWSGGRTYRYVKPSLALEP